MSRTAPHRRLAIAHGLAALVMLATLALAAAGSIASCEGPAPVSRVLRGRTIEIVLNPETPSLGPAYPATSRFGQRLDLIDPWFRAG